LLEAFNLEEVERAARSLPSHRHRLAFGAGIAERLLPNYGAFSREVRWGDPGLLRLALDLVWQIVAGGTAQLGKVRELQARIRSATPDTQDFASPLTSAAVDASSAVHEVLEVCHRDEPRRIAEVASLARDTVDLYVQERDSLRPDDPLFEQRILGDSLMIRELNKQRSEIELLSRARLDPAFVQRYRDHARFDGKSTISIS